MVIAVAAPETFERRLERWLLSAPIAELHRNTKIARSTLHAWATGRLPEGIVRWAMERFLEVWEAERRAAAQARPPVKAAPPPARRWS